MNCQDSNNKKSFYANRYLSKSPTEINENLQQNSWSISVAFIQFELKTTIHLSLLCEATFVTEKVTFWERGLPMSGSFEYKLPFQGPVKWPPILRNCQAASAGGWLSIRVAAHSRLSCKCDNPQPIGIQHIKTDFSGERVKALIIFCINHGDQRVFFNLKSSSMS